MLSAIVGREAELAVITRFLDGVEDGSAALILDGEPGIGKTTLWDAGVALARERGRRVLVARPAEAEAKLPFTALGDVLRGIPSGSLSVLPDPQREALEVALVREGAKGRPPQPRAVALALLEILRSVATEGPAVVAVDDWQWLDPASSNALTFAFRRLGSEPVRLLASRRVVLDEGHHALKRALGEERILHVPVGPMDVDQLDQVLRSRAQAELARPNLVQLRRITGGNPFFALEIVRALERRGEWPRPGEPIPVPRSLHDVVRERLAGMPPEAKEMALMISALAQPTTAVLEAIGWDERLLSTALAQLIEAGVLELDGDRIRFTHPLLSSVLYSAALPGERRRVHARLAGVVADPEERARHRALCAEGADEGVAALLDDAAERARGRGSPEAAAELLEQARRLTPSDQANDALRRGMTAAQFWLEAGDPTRARSILEGEIASSAPGVERARALTILAWVRGPEEWWHGPSVLLERALGEAGDDVGLRVDIELGLSWVEQLTGTIRVAMAHADEALRLAERSDDRAALAEALAGVVFLRAMAGEPFDPALLERAMSLEEEAERMWPLFRPRWLHAVMLEWAGRCDVARTMLEPLRDRAVETGDVQSLPFILTHLAREGCYLGRWEEAEREAEEADRLAQQSGQWQERAFTLASRAVLAAHRGDEEAARSLIQEGRSHLGDDPSSGTTIPGFELRSAQGFLELSQGDVAAADRILGSLARDVDAAGILEPGVFRFHADAVEAALGIGEVARARALLDRFERVRWAPGAWTAATAARCSGLVRAAEGELDEALVMLERAVSLHDALPEPVELGRTLLALGALHRRSKRRRDARETLERARAVFDGLGATSWSRRARSELERIGGRAPDRWSLTSTERRVAELASVGRTNKEIAAALYLSPKTVEVNLTRVYRKLGIRSRTELAGGMPTASRQPLERAPDPSEP